MQTIKRTLSDGTIVEVHVSESEKFSNTEAQLELLVDHRANLARRRLIESWAWGEDVFPHPPAKVLVVGALQ